MSCRALKTRGLRNSCANDERSSVQVVVFPNLNFPFPDIFAYKHHHVQKGMGEGFNNTKVRLVHKYMYVVKALVKLGTC